MRHTYPLAVHLFFFQNNQVLLLRRFNTGYEDGNYSVPAGHVEAGESATQCAIREAREEAGVELNPQHVVFAQVMHRKSDDERVNFFLSSHSGVARSPTPSRTSATTFRGIHLTRFRTI